MANPVNTVLYEAVTVDDPGVPGQSIVTFLPIHLVAVATPVITLPLGATPSVADFNRFRTSGTTPITQFEDGVEGQSFLLIFDHTMAMVSTATLKLEGSANKTFAVGDRTRFTTWDGGVSWTESGRALV